MTTPFRPGTIVVLYLRDPREKIWGMLLDLNPAGIALQGLDLRSFDDWLRSLVDNDEQEIRPSQVFYPLLRVEKILVDESADGALSLDAQCIARTGRGLRDHLGTGGAP